MAEKKPKCGPNSPKKCYFCGSKDVSFIKGVYVCNTCCEKKFKGLRTFSV